MMAGCATGPKYEEVRGGFPSLSAEQGRIYFYRSSNPFGSGIQPSVMLNGEKVGDSRPGGFFFVDRTPGNQRGQPDHRGGQEAHLHARSPPGTVRAHVCRPGRHRVSGAIRNWWTRRPGKRN
ncbi:MAG: DUF2846 domain-containing protein [Comamonadaceae bacterium]|nr:DUF2846 domain-containing protein [Comamonadaceae bacterium]